MLLHRILSGLNDMVYDIFIAVFNDYLPLTLLVLLVFVAVAIVGPFFQ